MRPGIPFARMMARLALLAALLLVLAPSISRVLAGRGGDVLAGWVELCTPAGLKWVDTAAKAARGKAPAAPLSGWPDDGDACPQCPLAAALPPPPEAFDWASPPCPPAPARGFETSLARAAFRPAGAGCRGPPAV
ncbi:DUF2946 family protein [Pseudomonas sp. R2.Fl]|nr:DUF2946 family protein [Pseudomonas sp. R2.Fl]